MTASLRSAAGGWDGAGRVLCVRLDAMGDVLMTTPALRALGTSRPRRLTLLASQAGAQIAAFVPDVRDVIVYEAPWMKAAGPRSDAAPDEAMIARLRAARFDAAVIFTTYSQSPLPAALLCFMAGIPLRLAHCHENPYQLLTDWVRDREPTHMVRHEVRRQLDLVAAVGAVTSDETLSLTVPAAARGRVRRLLDALQVAERRWIVLHPGGTAPSRRYPPESFAEVARRLTAESGDTIVFTGNADEQGIVLEIQRRMGIPSLSLAGRLDLEEMIALVAEAPLLVSNNTGPVHIAAAVGTPVVDLYALTNPQHTPWGVPHRVLFQDVPCKYCYKSVCPERHHACLRGVAPEDVVAAALALRESDGDDVARVRAQSSTALGGPGSVA